MMIESGIWPQIASGSLAPIEKIYRAITTEEGIKAWWTTDVKMDADIGGKAVFGFEKHHPSAGSVFPFWEFLLFEFVSDFRFRRSFVANLFSSAFPSGLSFRAYRDQAQLRFVVRVIRPGGLSWIPTRDCCPCSGTHGYHALGLALG